MVLGRTLGGRAGRADRARRRGRGAPRPVAAGVHARRAARRLAGRVAGPGAGRRDLVGLRVAQRSITVNLSPATLPKPGSGFDLAIAVATLAGAGGHRPGRRRAAWSTSASSGSTGGCGRCAGSCPRSRPPSPRAGAGVVVAEANAAEARLVPGARVVGATSLAEVAARYGAEPSTAPSRCRRRRARARPDVVRGHAALDLADVVGQERRARRCLEVAAAGGHHLLHGRPAGRRQDDARLAAARLLPDLTEADAVEVTAVHSVAGDLRPRRRAAAPAAVRGPAPHRDARRAWWAAAPGSRGPGRRRARTAGCCSSTRRPEFSTARPADAAPAARARRAGASTARRARARYPARFQLVLAANPCPCGKRLGKGLDVHVPPRAAPPLLRAGSPGRCSTASTCRSRCAPVSRVDRAAADGVEPSAVVAARVAAARAGRTGTPGWDAVAHERRGAGDVVA